MGFQDPVKDTIDTEESMKYISKHYYKVHISMILHMVACITEPKQSRIEKWINLNLLWCFGIKNIFPFASQMKVKLLWMPSHGYKTEFTFVNMAIESFQK